LGLSLTFRRLAVFVHLFIDETGTFLDLSFDARFCLLSVGCSCNGDPSEQTTRGSPVLLPSSGRPFGDAVQQLPFGGHNAPVGRTNCTGFAVSTLARM
jgi:hypothetical protein